jgi:hypothetical protein
MVKVDNENRHMIKNIFNKVDSDKRHVIRTIKEDKNDGQSGKIDNQSLLCLMRCHCS